MVDGRVMAHKAAVILVVSLLLVSSVRSQTTATASTTTTPTMTTAASGSGSMTTAASNATTPPPTSFGSTTAASGSGSMTTAASNATTPPPTSFGSMSGSDSMNVTRVNATVVNTTSFNSTNRSNNTQPNITSQGGNGTVDRNASGSATPAGTPKSGSTAASSATTPPTTKTTTPPPMLQDTLNAHICSVPEAKKCAEKYAGAYGCHITNISLPFDDPCSQYVRGSEDNENDNCLEKDCSCDCADESALSPCKQKYCSPMREGTCAPGCQYAEIADGTCQGFCMNSFCNFDGGDCLSSPAWYLSLSEALTRLDGDGDRRISREEYESSLWLLPNFNPRSGGDGGPDLFSLCDNQKEGLSIKHLALGERGEGKSAGGGHFSLVSHAQVDQLNTALYIMGSADENMDGSLSFQEAEESYKLTWDEYAYINALAYGGSEVEAEEVASLLFSVVETLRGKPWADRESFYGADVAASVTIKMLSRCDRAHIGELEAQALGITRRGLQWADSDGSGTLDIPELLRVLKQVNVGGAAVHVDLTEGMLEAHLGMPGVRPAETRLLLLPDWHYQIPFARAALTDANKCSHADARLEEIRRILFHRNRLPSRRAPSTSMTVDKVETDRRRRQRAERALNRTLANAGSDAVRDGCVSGFCVTREQGGASPRLVAMMRESDTDTSNASLGSTLEKAYVGTSKVRPLQFPFVVSLERSLGSSSEQYCGGTLIHPKWVLTSAGCVAGMNLTDVVSSHVAVLGGHQCVKGSVETRHACFANQLDCTQGTPAPSSSAPPPKPTEPLADVLKMYPAYLMASAESWDPSQQRFLDLSGNDRVGTLQAGTVNVGNVTGHGANLNRSVPYAEGTTGTQISWGAGSIPQNFTICSVTRYSGAAKKRILQCNDTDWLHGHGTGSAEPGAGFTFYGDGFDGGLEHKISPNTDWVVACGRNIGSTLSPDSVSTLINGVSTTVAQGGEGDCELAINLGVQNTENDGDWQLSRVYVWDVHLPDAVFANASARLVEHLTAPEVPPMKLEPPPPAPPFTTGQCDGGCQGNISQSGTSGTISVGGPNSTYANYANCTWLISSVAEITISFSFFDTEPGSDFVTINRCSSPTCGTVEQVAQLSGNSSLSTYTSPTGYLQVVFTSDDNGTAAGFIASWSTPFTGGTTRARLSRVVIHPLYQVDQHYDVALIELEHEILGFEPAPLDDGSDLGFPLCKHPTLTTVGWWPSTQEELTAEELTAGGLWASPPSWDALDIDVDKCVSVEEFNAYCDAMGCGNVTFNDFARASSDDNTCPPTTFSRADYTELTMGIDMNLDSTPIRRQTLEHVDSEACRQHHLDAQGFQEVGTNNLAICARAFGMSNESLGTCRERGYFGQDGGALLSPLEGTPDGYVLVGVIRKGHGAAASALDNNTGNRDCPLDKLPRAHVRVAGMRQWILSVSDLGASVPKRLKLSVDALHLPPESRASLRVYAGPTDEESQLLETMDGNRCIADQRRSFESSGGGLGGGLLLTLSDLDSGTERDGACSTYFTFPEKGYDYPKNDILIAGSTGSTQANPAACAAICIADPTCVGFVFHDQTFSGRIYNKQATISAGSCFPKSSMKTPYKFPDGAEIYAYRRSSSPTDWDSEKLSWGRDCSVQHVAFSIAPFGCKDNAAKRRAIGEAEAGVVTGGGVGGGEHTFDVSGGGVLMRRKHRHIHNQPRRRFAGHKLNLEHVTGFQNIAPDSREDSQVPWRFKEVEFVMRVATEKMAEARKAAAVTFTSLAYKVEVNQENDNQHDKHDDERTGRLLKQQKQKQEQEQNRGTRMLLQSDTQPNMTKVSHNNTTVNTTTFNSTFRSNNTQPNITSQGGNGNVNRNASDSATPAGTPKPETPSQFSLMDTNKDGCVSASEWMVNTLYPGNTMTVSAIARFTSADDCGNTAISVADFRAFLLPQNAYLMTWFLMDTDGNECVSEKELCNIMCTTDSINGCGIVCATMMKVIARFSSAVQFTRPTDLQPVSEICRNIKRADFLEFMALASHLNRTSIEPDIEFENRVLWYQIDTNADDCLSEGEFNAAFCADRACPEMDKIAIQYFGMSLASLGGEQDTSKCGRNASYADFRAYMDALPYANSCVIVDEGGIDGCMVDIVSKECRPRNCTLSAVSYEDLVYMEKIGKAFLGGLGGMSSKDSRSYYGVWACVRGWNEAEQRRCGVTSRQLACFKYEERSRVFEYMGTNEEVNLVSSERQQDGMARESRLSSLLV